MDDPVDVIDDADLLLVPDLDLRPEGTAPRFVLGIHSSLAVRLLEVEMARSAKVLFPEGKLARLDFASPQYNICRSSMPEETAILKESFRWQV